VDRKVGMLGLEVVWFVCIKLGGFDTFEGVRRASLDAVGDADDIRDISGAIEGLRSLDTGN